MILAGVLIAGLVTAAVTNYVTKKSGEIVKQK
jgi:hypothetical protein